MGVNVQLEQKAAGVIAIALALSLTIFTYEREILPLYGAVPTTFLLETVTFAAILFSAVQPFPIPLKLNLLLAAIAFTLAPNATYWVAVWTARRKHAVWGPALTHTFVLAPLTFFLTTFVVEMDTPYAKQPSSKRSSPVLRLLRGTMTYLVSFILLQRIWYPSQILYSTSGSQIFLFLAAIFYSLRIYSSSVRGKDNATSKTSRKKLGKRKASSLSRRHLKIALLVGFAAFWYQIHTLFVNPVLPHPLPNVYTHPKSPLQILSAEQSVTGVITVVEWLPPLNHNREDDTVMHSMRYLRASHSLLGGVWVRDKVETLDNEELLKDSYGNPLGDSIYVTFLLQEAGLLVDSTETGKAGSWKNALVIGLGTGISANAFMRHNISTSIVEIDPAVYNAARKWFGLADPGVGQVFLEDARIWVAEKRAKVETDSNETLYDIVVHDCFSGGGVPQHIFTVEFWDDLKAVMASEAVLVVNFAGIIDSESSRLVVNTLERKFGQCRAFHDSFKSLEQSEYDTEFVNIVVFCTRSSEPLTFRSTQRSDWLGSPLRRFILQSLPSREVNLSVIRTLSDARQIILTDEHNPLGALQQKQASHHWQIMRDVLPSIHWETY